MSKKMTAPIGTVKTLNELFYAVVNAAIVFLIFAVERPDFAPTISKSGEL